MKTNKERGYYEIVYICMNCKYELWRTVDYGKPIPMLVQKDDGFGMIGKALAPECPYCGCLHWLHGKTKSL